MNIESQVKALMNQLDSNMDAAVSIQGNLLYALKHMHGSGIVETYERQLESIEATCVCVRACIERLIAVNERCSQSEW